MPKYDYKCKKCGDMELEKKMAAEDPKKCPDCGGTDFSRIWDYAPPVKFNGTGFYETDYKK